MEAVLHDHMAVTVACDFFVAPTVTFQRLFCFVVMSLDRRRIVHVNVTKNRTAEWVAQQIVAAFPGDGWGRWCIYEKAPTVKGVPFCVVVVRESPPIPAGIYSHS